jgi:hypothetical protein
MNGVPLLGEHRTFCRFAPALTLYAADHATSLIALNATALDALTSRPRKARREPMLALVFEESLLAFDIETPPSGSALTLPR